MDYEAMAKAVGLELAPEELRRVTAPLDALERVFRPLAQDLPPDLEPSRGVLVEEDE